MLLLNINHKLCYCHDYDCAYHSSKYNDFALLLRCLLLFLIYVVHCLWTYLMFISYCDFAVMSLLIELLLLMITSVIIALWCFFTLMLMCVSCVVLFVISQCMITYSYKQYDWYVLHMSSCLLFIMCSLWCSWISILFDIIMVCRASGVCYYYVTWRCVLLICILNINRYWKHEYDASCMYHYSWSFSCFVIIITNF